MPAVQIDLSIAATCRTVTPKLLEYEAETLPTHTFRCADYKNVIKWNLKNALLCLVFADPVTFYNKNC